MITLRDLLVRVEGRDGHDRHARCDRRSERVMITLNTGAVVGFPLSALPGLERAAADDLRKIEVEDGGYGLHVARLDADISGPALLADQPG